MRTRRSTARSRAAAISTMLAMLAASRCTSGLSLTHAGGLSLTHAGMNTTSALLSRLPSPSMLMLSWQVLAGALSPALSPDWPGAASGQKQRPSLSATSSGWLARRTAPTRRRRSSRCLCSPSWQLFLEPAKQARSSSRPHCSRATCAQEWGARQLAEPGEWACLRGHSPASPAGRSAAACRPRRCARLKSARRRCGSCKQEGGRGHMGVGGMAAARTNGHPVRPLQLSTGAAPVGAALSSQPHRLWYDLVPASSRSAGQSGTCRGKMPARGAR